MTIATGQAETDEVERGLKSLVCTECGVTSGSGEGWKAELAVRLLDDDESDKERPNEVAVFCPRCWSREFSDS